MSSLLDYYVSLISHFGLLLFPPHLYSIRFLILLFERICSFFYSVLHFIVRICFVFVSDTSAMPRLMLFCSGLPHYPCS